MLFFNLLARLSGLITVLKAGTAHNKTTGRVTSSVVRWRAAVCQVTARYNHSSSSCSPGALWHRNSESPEPAHGPSPAPPLLAGTTFPGQPRAATGWLGLVGQVCWTTVVHGSPRWSILVHGGPQWTTVDQPGPQWKTPDHALHNQLVVPTPSKSPNFGVSYLSAHWS